MRHDIPLHKVGAARRARALARRSLPVALVLALVLAGGAVAALACASCTLQIPTQKSVDPHRYSVAINLSTYLMLGTLYGVLASVGLIVYRTLLRPRHPRSRHGFAGRPALRATPAAPATRASEPVAGPALPLHTLIRTP